MLKKFMGFIAIAILVLSIPMVCYADLTIEFEDNDALTMIEPNLGSENQIILRDVMTISIKPQRNVTTCLSLYQIMPSVDEEFDDIVEIVNQEIDLLDEIYSVENIILSDEYSYTNLEFENIKELEAIKEAVDEFKEKTSTEEREEVVSDFHQIKKDFDKRVEKFNEQRDEVHEVFKDEFPLIGDCTSKQALILDRYKKMVERMREDINMYQSQKEEYVALFKTVLFEYDPIVPSGVVPYYNRSVENISSGFYELVFSDIKTGEVLEVVNFEIIRKEVVTEDVIRETVLKYMNSLSEPLE